MSNCHECAYQANVPGDCHISCRFDWSKRKDIRPPMASEQGIIHGWYIFPFNYDPAWQLEQCKAFSTERDENFIKKTDPLIELFSLFLK